MSEWVHQWAVAYALTQAVEMPVYLLFTRGRPTARRWLHAAGASTLTHPLLWFAIPWEEIDAAGHYWPVVWTAEAVIVAVEGAYGRMLALPRPFAASLVANAASFLTGLMFQGVG